MLLLLFLELEGTYVEDKTQFWSCISYSQLTFSYLACLGSCYAFGVAIPWEPVLVGRNGGSCFDTFDIFGI